MVELALVHIHHGVRLLATEKKFHLLGTSLAVAVVVAIAEVTVQAVMVAVVLPMEIQLHYQQFLASKTQAVVAVLVVYLRAQVAQALSLSVTQSK
jgi:hypothetical protein